MIRGADLGIVVVVRDQGLLDRPSCQGRFSGSPCSGPFFDRGAASTVEEDRRSEGRDAVGSDIVDVGFDLDLGSCCIDIVAAVVVVEDSIAAVAVAVAFAVADQGSREEQTCCQAGKCRFRR